MWEEERDGISIFEEKSGQLVLVYRYVLTIASGPIMIKRAIAFIKKYVLNTFYIPHTVLGTDDEQNLKMPTPLMHMFSCTWVETDRRFFKK